MKTRACPTGKTRHATRKAARAALLSTRVAAALRSNAKRRERRVYCCPACDGWHLTSNRPDRST